MARAGSALLINKLFAVYYGPNGITLLAHFQNLITLLTTLPNTGVNVGLIRHLAHQEPDTAEYQSYFWAGIWLNVLTFLAGCLAFALFPSFFLDRFIIGDPVSGHVVNLVVALILFLLVLLQLFWLSVLLARQAMRPFVWLSFLTSITSIAITWWAVGTVSLTTALVLFLVGQALSGVVGAFVLLKQTLIPALTTKIPPVVWRNLSKFIIMALASLVGKKLVDFGVREMVMDSFSLHDTGLWQSVVKISDSYTMVYISVLGMVYYPKIASLLPRPEALKEYVRSVFMLLVPVVGFGLVVIGLLRDFFILLLFQDEFLTARELMDYQLVGDFLKMVSWLFSYIISVQARVKLYVVTELASGLLYLGLVAYLLPLLGLEGLPMAHAINYGVNLVFFLFLFRSFFRAT